MYYSPVRHSVNPASWVFLVRLACIRHAASVYPEPGSNSPFDLTLLTDFRQSIPFELTFLFCALFPVRFSKITASLLGECSSNLSLFFCLCKYFLRFFVENFRCCENFPGKRFLIVFITTRTRSIACLTDFSHYFYLFLLLLLRLTAVVYIPQTNS